MSRKSKSKRGQRKRRARRSRKEPVASRRMRLPPLPDLVLWAGFMLVPLVFVPGVADEFRLPKLAAAEVLFGASCLALILRGAIVLGAKLRAYLWATVPFVAVAFSSVVAGEHGDHGRIALWSLLFGWLVGLCWSGRDHTLERVLWWMTPAAVVVAGLGLVQAMGWWTPIVITDERQRLQVISLVGNAGELASYLVLPATFAAWRSLRAWNRSENLRKRVGWPLVFVIFAAAVTATQTATALLLIAAVAGLLAVTQPRRRMARILLPAVAVVGLAAVLLSPAASRIGGKLGELARGQWADLTTGRTDGWTIASELLRQEPLLGVGFGGYAAEFTSTKLELAEQGVGFFTKHVGQSTFANAHSEPLEVAAEMGWLGVLALLWMTAVVVVPLVRGWRRQQTEEEREQGLLHAVILVAMVGLAATYFPMRTAILAYPFLFCFVALLPGTVRPQSADTKNSEPSTSTRAEGGASDRVLAGGRRWILAAVVALLLVQSARISWQRIRSSADLRAAESIGETMIRGGRIYPTVLRPLIPKLELAMERTPWDERIPQAIAGYHLLLRDTEAAEVWYRRSFEVAARPETIDSMGRLLHREGRIEEAVPWFVRAVRLDGLRIRTVPDDVRGEVRRLASKQSEP